jgi:hypothetical protein
MNAVTTKYQFGIGVMPTFAERDFRLPAVSPVDQGHPHVDAPETSSPNDSLRPLFARVERVAIIVRGASVACDADWPLSAGPFKIRLMDHRFSLRRSSHGKSNKVARIWVVNSTETRSTQSKVKSSFGPNLSQ